MEARRAGRLRTAAPTASAPRAPHPAERAGGRGRAPTAYWYRLEGSGPRVVQAADEAAAREAMLARHPEAEEQRLTLEPHRL